MGLIFKFKKYLCCSADELQQSRAAVSLIHKDQAKPKVFHSEPESIQYLLIPSHESVVELHPLSAAEVFEEVDEDISPHTAVPTYSIARLPALSSPRPTLVLDLDNTLIYSSVKEISRFDHKFTVTYNGKQQDVWIVERPGLQAFLAEMASMYEIVLFTAGIKQYGVKVMREIDKNMHISYFLDRRFCTMIGKNNKNQDFFAKDIRILGRDLARVLIVDDRAYSFCFDACNGILVSMFNGDPEDRCLESLQKYLSRCSTLKDMRCRVPFEEERALANEWHHTD